MGIQGAYNPSAISDNDQNRLTFEKLRKNPVERSRLENIHAARGHRYGTVHLGPKKWYQDIWNLSLNLKTQSDRRKFRAGLKGDIDFLNQLNMLDFEDCLKGCRSDGVKTSKRQDMGFTYEQMAKLKELSLIELIKLVNEEN